MPPLFFMDTPFPLSQIPSSSHLRAGMQQLVFCCSKQGCSRRAGGRWRRWQRCTAQRAWNATGKRYWRQHPPTAGCVDWGHASKLPVMESPSRRSSAPSTLAGCPHTALALTDAAHALPRGTWPCSCVLHSSHSRDDVMLCMAPILLLPSLSCSLAFSLRKPHDLCLST